MVGVVLLLTEKDGVVDVFGVVVVKLKATGVVAGAVVAVAVMPAVALLVLDGKLNPFGAVVVLVVGRLKLPVVVLGGLKLPVVDAGVDGEPNEPNLN